MCDDFFDDFDWMDLGIAGAMAEELADEEIVKRRRQLEEDLDQDDLGDLG